MQPIVGRIPGRRSKVAQGRQEAGEGLARTRVRHQQCVASIARLGQHFALMSAHAPSARIEPCGNLMGNVGGRIPSHLPSGHAFIVAFVENLDVNLRLESIQLADRLLEHSGDFGALGLAEFAEFAHILNVGFDRFEFLHHGR